MIEILVMFKDCSAQRKVTIAAYLTLFKNILPSYSNISSENNLYSRKFYIHSQYSYYSSYFRFFSPSHLTKDRPNLCDYIYFL